MRKAILLVVAFLSGGLLMALEIVGSRVLAPYFGGSIRVWGSLISVFMAALSVGYFIGGRVVDKYPKPLGLFIFLAIAGLLVIVIPYVDDPISLWIEARDFGPYGNPLVACMAFFFLPSVCMAVTSPFVIRLTTESVEKVGRTAGAVYAISTIGSIAGTLGAAFYLIPALGTTLMIHLLGLGLIATGVLALIAGEKRLGGAGKAAILVLCASFALASPVEAQERILLERDSSYHRLFVTEDGRQRWLRADNIWHTQMDLNDPHGRGLPYSDYIDLAFLMKPDIRRVLVIGLGGGTVPKRFLRDYPQVFVDAVEIDAAVISIAKRYFYVEEGPRLKIHEADGRAFLRRTQEQWDLIMLDAYYADTVPFFLTTREFFNLAKSRLTPGGVLVNNVVGQVSGPRSRFFRSVHRTMDEIFPQIYAFRVPDSGTAWINIQVFGVNSQERLPPEELRRRATNMQGRIIKDDKLLERVGNLLTETVRTDDVPTLTDDYAPVDALLHLW